MVDKNFRCLLEVEFLRKEKLSSPHFPKCQLNVQANMINDYFTRFSGYVENLLFHFHSNINGIFQRTFPRMLNAFRLLLISLFIIRFELLLMRKTCFNFHIQVPNKKLSCFKSCLRRISIAVKQESSSFSEVEEICV